MSKVNIAQVFIDGNLTADPETKKVAGGKEVTTFSIAVNHIFNGDVSFIDIEAWDKNSDLCKQYLSKGDKVTVLGELKQDRWKSPEGSTRQRLKIIARQVRFDGSRHAKEEGVLEKKAA